MIRILMLFGNALALQKFIRQKMHTDAMRYADGTVRFYDASIMHCLVVNSEETTNDLISFEADAIIEHESFTYQCERTMALIQTRIRRRPPTGNQLRKHDHD